MVNDRTGGSSAYNLGDGKSIGAEQFNVGLNAGLNLKKLDSDSKDYYKN